MLCAVFVIALTGVVTGTRLRLGRLIVLSLLVFVVWLVSALSAGWSIVGAVGSALGLTATLEITYLVGAILGSRRLGEFVHHATLERNTNVSNRPAE